MAPWKTTEMYWKLLMYNSIRILPVVFERSLTGCSVDPQYQRPDVTLPEQLTAPSTDGAVIKCPLLMRETLSSDIAFGTRN